MPLEESNKAARTISLTAFAFAPGVLKTTTPFFEHCWTGTLFTPAPALAIALSELSKSSSVNLKLLSNNASGDLRSSETSNLNSFKREMPVSAMALYVFTLKFI